jgi:HSP20 family protein
LIMLIIVKGWLSNYLITHKRQKMTHTNLTCPEIKSDYLRQYIPAPLTLDELMDELQKPHEGETKPLINLAEMPDAFIIEVAAPGLKSDDFLVSIDENLLSIAVLHKEAGTVNKLYHQHEFNYCCFKREIVLPGNVDADFLSAMYEDGILCIRLPKSKERVLNHVERIIIY